MIFTIKVKTRAKKTLVRQIDSTYLEVSVTKPPVNGKANDAIIEVLAEYFHVSKNRISIISGQKSKMKVIEVV